MSHDDLKSSNEEKSEEQPYKNIKHLKAQH